MKDDGRLWALGAIGMLAAAGVVGRRMEGSAYVWLDELEHGGRGVKYALDHGGYTVIRQNDGQEILISIPYGVYRGVERDREEEMDLFLRRRGLVQPDPPLNGGSEADLYEYMPLDVYVAEIPADLSEVLRFWGNTLEGEILEMLHKGASHEVHHHDAERIAAEVATRNPMRRVRILQMVVRARGHSQLMYALHIAPVQMTANEIRRRWPHFVGPLRRVSFRGDVIQAPWMKR